MKKIFYLYLFVLLFQSFSEGKGLLGERYGHIAVGTYFPEEDMKVIDDEILNVSLFSNIPVTRNVDFGISFETRSVEGGFMGDSVESTDWLLGGSFINHFIPQGKVDPFIGVGAFYLEERGKIEDNLWKEEDFQHGGLSLFLGAEVMLGNNISSSTSLRWLQVGDREDVTIEEMVHIWITDTLGGAIHFLYFDSGSYSVLAGITLDI